jgi:2-dehydro-3-deoxyphosphooctonate aldolase (KDO 8-P synthase)
MALEHLEKLKYKNSDNFFLMAGPCVVEDMMLLETVVEKVKTITDKLNIPYIFKASYRKANRSRLDSYTGIGDIEALEMLAVIRQKYDVPVVTDIHSAEEATMAAKYVDILQIPAFLCRQTDILVAAAETGKYVNIKKGQFLSAEAMKYAVDKVAQSGNNNIILTDRGTMFGYGDMVVDFRGIPTMKNLNVPVVMDVTHSLQQPNQTSGVTGGLPQMINTIARCAIAAGADGIFIETHPNPAIAKSDGANMLALDKIEKLLTELTELRKVVKRF